ncbi:MAG: helix-turn-helix domain-containing protein [Verrucomicrobiae bacterium]|nr:helix-turn-helix domain-containing protein [Verrucomicrobiae bacterium]
MTRFAPNRKDFEPYGFTCVRWEAAIMNRPDRHNEIELNLLETGQITYLLFGQKIVVPARRLAVFWAAVPHHTIAYEGLTEYYVSTIPLVWFLQWRLPEHFTHLVLHGHLLMEPDDSRGVLDAAQFRLWIQDITAPSEDQRRAMLLEMEARLRRLALRIPPDPAGPPTKRHHSTILGAGTLNHAERIAAFIAQHYTQPLTLEDISRHVNLHPNYIIGVFRRVFGTTPLEYILQHRLSHAQRLLATTDDLILEIALNSGFGSLSRFNEAFRRAFGCTPREYRRRHRVTS